MIAMRGVYLTKPSKVLSFPIINELDRDLDRPKGPWLLLAISCMLDSV